MRMTWADLTRAARGDTGTAAKSEDSESNLIYYLKTSKHSAGDVSLSGPYLTHENLLTQVLARLAAEKSHAGREALLEMGEATRELHHFNAPLPDGNVIRFDFIHENNAEVLHQGAGPYYVVRLVVPKLGSNGRPTLGVLPGGGRFMQTADVEHIKTFTSAQAAVVKARAKLTELKNTAGPTARVIELGETDDRQVFNGFVQGGGTGGQPVMQIISVFKDDGIADPQRSFSDLH
jgi:hypothetical protein